jgi:hypothetical protein
MGPGRCKGPAPFLAGLPLRATGRSGTTCARPQRAAMCAGVTDESLTRIQSEDRVSPGIPPRPEPLPVLLAGSWLVTWPLLREQEPSQAEATFSQRDRRRVRCLERFFDANIDESDGRRGPEALRSPGRRALRPSRFGGPRRLAAECRPWIGIPDPAVSHGLGAFWAPKGASIGIPSHACGWRHKL